MVELQAPFHAEPKKPVRKYYETQEGDAIGTKRVETEDKYQTGKTTPNETVIDDYEFKKLWYEYGKDMEQWKRSVREWQDNNARAYHLVLLHCGPCLTAELMNPSSWLAGDQA